MKKIFLPMAFAAALFSLASCKGKSEEEKKKFVNTCMAQSAQQVDDPKMKEYYKEYCECSAENVYEKYSPKEVQDMEAEANKTGNSAAMLDKLMPEIKPCLENLQKNLSASAAPAQ